MSNAPPVRPVTLADIEAARVRIAPTILRTPLVRLDLGPGGPDIRLKLENLQPTNSYKLRGAANAVAQLDAPSRARGVWTISAGNAGQGVAYAARAAGVRCKVVVIDTAPQTKLERMAALGAELVPVPFETAWRALEQHAFDGMDGTLIHPFDDHDFIAGHGSLALEVLEDCPNVAAIVGAVGGGGLLSGVGAAMKARAPHVRVIAVEPETAAPFALSRQQGRPCEFPNWRASFVDGAGGKNVIPRMWERMAPVVDDALVVSLDETRRAMRLMAEKARVIAEGAGALAFAAALSDQVGSGPIVCVVSGGNIDLAKLCELIGA